MDKSSAIEDCIRTWQELTDTMPSRVVVPLGWRAALLEEWGSDGDGLALLYVLGIPVQERDVSAPMVLP